MSPKCSGRYSSKAIRTKLQTQRHVILCLFQKEPVSIYTLLGKITNFEACRTTIQNLHERVTWTKQIYNESVPIYSPTLSSIALFLWCKLGKCCVWPSKNTVSDTQPPGLSYHFHLSSSDTSYYIAMENHIDVSVCSDTEHSIRCQGGYFSSFLARSVKVLSDCRGTLQSGSRQTRQTDCDYNNCLQKSITEYCHHKRDAMCGCLKPWLMEKNNISSVVNESKG